jgi:hypothetical protein
VTPGQLIAKDASVTGRPTPFQVQFDACQDGGEDSEDEDDHNDARHRARAAAAVAAAVPRRRKQWMVSVLEVDGGKLVQRVVPIMCQLDKETHRTPCQTLYAAAAKALNLSVDSIELLDAKGEVIPRDQGFVETVFPKEFVDAGAHIKLRRSSLFDMCFCESSDLTRLCCSQFNNLPGGGHSDGLQQTHGACRPTVSTFGAKSTGVVV